MDPRSTHRGSTGLGPPPFVRGEVLVALPYKPAFPGIIADGETPSLEIESLEKFPDLEGQGSLGDIGLRCRRSVAQWIGVYLESFYGNAQVRFEWHGDTLEIYDDPWGLSLDSEPRTIHPDSEGRYEIRDVWLPIAAPLAADLHHRHGPALTVLAGDAPPHPAPEMLAYLSDHPGAPTRMPSHIERALDAITAPR
ncbi:MULTISPECIES: hypothetical protein [Amycolatopsis]|uniref:Uncharacterized protein n=2 Tax=Amycolatopsis TaxID=1813 RepID=A0A2N3WEX2_9PSEU|nr:MULTISPECIES: hypothetical protein [Amycolatopsis]MBB2505968.1 hypothetical protein [Amycolatopsis echigonensis]PKV92444.1 hypothetical protein ATK30_3248 [Amycolatopsis niigatensis]TVT16774.1 hypothetical protein FNH06_34050 [Amycolatopsis acidiphila]UIJ59630.1 hypothetical protein LWP59_37370 [Amycolatopsis acidiphila]